MKKLLAALFIFCFVGMAQAGMDIGGGSTGGGSGNVTGPASSVANSIACYSDTGGKTLLDCAALPDGSRQVIIRKNTSSVPSSPTNYMGLGAVLDGSTFLSNGASQYQVVTGSVGGTANKPVFTTTNVNLGQVQEADFSMGTVADGGMVDGKGCVYTTSTGKVTCDSAFKTSTVSNTQIPVADSNGNFVASGCTADGSGNMTCTSGAFSTVTGASSETLWTGNGTATAKNEILNSYGRSGAVTTTLPAASAGLNFTAIVGTQHNSAWKIQRAGSDTIYADVGAGLVTGKTYIQETNQVVGSLITCFAFKTGASAWSWMCVAKQGAGYGTWVTD